MNTKSSDKLKKLNNNAEEYSGSPYPCVPHRETKCANATHINASDPTSNGSIVLVIVLDSKK